jgi:hypothetical protein
MEELSKSGCKAVLGLTVVSFILLVVLAIF